MCSNTSTSNLDGAPHFTQQLSKPNLGELVPFPRCPRRKRSIFRRGESDRDGHRPAGLDPVEQLRGDDLK